MEGTNVYAANGEINSEVTDTPRVLEDTQSRLEEIEKQKGMDAGCDRYVAFFRDQSARLDEIEAKFDRIGSVLKPIRKVKYGFDVQPLSVKTIWRIIYSILGCLGVMSLLFFLRWYGLTKTEDRQELIQGLVVQRAGIQYGAPCILVGNCAKGETNEGSYLDAALRACGTGCVDAGVSLAIRSLVTNVSVSEPVTDASVRPTWHSHERGRGTGGFARTSDLL